MHRSHTTVGGDDLPSFSDTQQIAGADRHALAVALLRDVFGHAPAATVSRRSVVRAPVGNLARAEREPLMRLLAEAWQLLEHAGYVCQDAEETRPDHWFLTGTGRGLLAAPAPIDTLKEALGNGR